MSGSLWVGVDPGASGAIALVSDDIIVGVMHLSSPVLDLFGFLRDYQAAVDFAILEQVNSFGAGGRKMGATSAFNFGASYGTASTLLSTSAVPFETRTPKQWQQAMGIKYEKAWTDTQKKNHTKSRAQALWPEFPFTHKTADAVLIAEYCRRWRTGLL